jgi:hypothetical protein
MKLRIIEGKYFDQSFISDSVCFVINDIIANVMKTKDPLGRSYSLLWYDPRKGEWEKPLNIRTDDHGALVIPSFPDAQNPSVTDWALKIKTE